MSKPFICWQCGKALEDVILPMSRREECAACHADQHVCKMCIFFEDKGRGSCTEEQAEWISDRERANFCDYFKPTSRDTHCLKESANEQALADLAALFGDAPQSEPPNVQASIEKDQSSPKTAAEIAEQQLRDLLGD